MNIYLQKLCACLLLSGALFTGCSNENDANWKNAFSVYGVSVPSSVTVVSGGLLTFSGSGVKADDMVELTASDGTGTAFTLPVQDVTDKTFSIQLPDDFVSGSYSVALVRAGEKLALGTLNINMAPASEVPDKEGMTVKGMVYCDGKGVPGVVVSDGFEVTVTDSKGIYYLPSQKKNGYVFISVPANYEVECKNGNEPQFFKYLAQTASVTEQHDFALRKVDNSHCKLFVMTDFHLANRNDDLSQYSQFVTDVNKTIAEESLEGNKVYGITLGDLSWDVYWYDNSFALPQFMNEVNKIQCPVFNLPGNHDNDPYKNNDWDAEEPYKEQVGPTYYSFNLGKAHIVMLDNTRYINTGASEGVIGERNYDGIVVENQMEWLKKDLACITDKSTPVIVGMHINLYANPTLTGGQQNDRVSLMNGNALKEVLSQFDNVQILTGHTHVNFTVEEDNLMEHNVAAVCATWWWTGKKGYAGNQICKDGSLGGYAVWDLDGDNLQWYYKGIGYDRNYQFRTYDLNETYITAAKYAPNSTDEKLEAYAADYMAKRSDNKVLINVWGYDENWKIEVTEEGKALPVERVSAKDPLHLISYEALRLNAGSAPTESFLTNYTAHMFEVMASSANSTLDIKVTDRFGNVYTETMTRPKALSCDMR